MGQRKDLREIACPRQRVDLTPAREDDGMEAGDQANHGRKRQSAGGFLAENGAEAVENRLARGSERKRPVNGGRDAARISDLPCDGNRRVDDEDEKSQYDERKHAE